MLLIDKLCYQSNLRYVNAGEKFIYAILTLCMCVVSRSIPLAVLVLAVNSYLIVGRGGIAFFRYRNLMLIPLVFLLLSTLAIIVNISGTPLDAFALPLGNLYITGSFQSLRRELQLILTAMASVSCLYFLALSTPMTDILNELRKLRIPALLLELMMLTYRFIFVLLEIASSILTSQKSRLGNRDLKTSLKSFGSMVSVLFIRSLKKSGALYDAMEARCYDGTIRVLTENHPPKRAEIFLIAFFEILLLLLTIWSKLQ